MAAAARAVSSAHGPLSRLLLQLPADAVRRPSRRAALASVLRSVPERTRLTVLVAANADAHLDALLGATGRAAEVVTAPPGLPFTVWAQDAFVALENGNGTCLLQPAGFDRAEDDRVAAVLAEATDLRAARSPLRFEGSNVLAGDDFVLVGRDSEFDDERPTVSVGTDLPVPSETRRETDGLLAIANEVTGKRQPLSHLDMFVTLAGRSSSGRYRLLVGSPAEADRILGRPPPEHGLHELFDDVAAGLEADGFEVIRNPLPLTYADGLRAVDGVEREVRRWYFASSNNCLVQIDDSEGHRVWLPTYGHGAWRELAATDAANREIWESLGFEVQELANFHTFAQDHGALHCIAKCLAR